ncbi:MAG: hypothetical protein CM15mP93_13740 [Thiotrichaceae bacterium]|nr:MAG: hypothetical protein CM15mP93_13740 [Thiotrichaceae bacterium]
MDANLLHISYEGKILEDPWKSPPENMWTWVNSVQKHQINLQTLL